MRLIFALFLFTISTQLRAQNADIHTSFPVAIDYNQRLSQESAFNFTAIVLKSRKMEDFSKIGFIHGRDTIYFSNDYHSSEYSEYFYSSPIHFDNPLQLIELYLSEEVDILEVVLVNGSGEYLTFYEQKYRDQNNDCELTGVIQQSEWRTGLPEPSYTRTFTTTENMIVHHSAGSNNITDFTQAVRDIYILHTEENGWSDIGYNYLVAPDGVIYAGRDPGDGEQDEVMGAHFCGSNSNTMGVCLLGNYENAEPSFAMLESLEDVLSWKAFNDELNVLSSNPHPLNFDLGVIAGHRDGCSTLCPGQNVYKQLQDIRLKVDEQLVVCRIEEGQDDQEDEIPVVELEIDSVLNQKIYPNPIRGDFSFNFDISASEQDDLENIEVFNQEGQRIGWQNLYFGENTIEVQLPNTLKPGIYFLRKSFINGEQKSQRFLIQ